MLFRDAQGVNFGKIYAKQIFNPTNMSDARNTITGMKKDYLLSKDKYSIPTERFAEESMQNKSQYLAGVFKTS